MRCVLIAAAGAPWESRALGLVEQDRDLVLLRRCLDVDDLLATATAGQADVAVVALEAPGLDAGAVEHLRRHEVGTLGVLPGDQSAEAGRARARRIGLPAVLGPGEVDTLPGALRELAADAPERSAASGAVDGVPAAPGPDDEPAPDASPGAGPVLAVWGPHGAPGRSTVAATLAGLLAARGAGPLLVDADPWGGSLGQQLGVLDEVSGLLAAARLETSGDLAGRWRELPRSVPPGLALVTGLPRPDRWSEVRPGVLEHLLALGRTAGPVVVDTGAALEEDPLDGAPGRPPRHGLTHAALDAADEVLVVGSADPVGLSRLARGLVELGERLADRGRRGTSVRVLVNRMRPTLGWSEREIAGMVEGFARVRGVHFLPEDRAAVDAALVAGRGLVEQGGSALAEALEPVADAHLGPVGDRRRRGRGGLRRRRAGRARRP